MASRDNFSKKNLIKIILLVVSLWILFAIFFGFYDLAISKKIVDENSLIGKFVAEVGEIPGFLIVSLSLFILGMNVDFKDKNLRLFVFGCIYLLNSIFVYFIFKNIIIVSSYDSKVFLFLASIIFVGFGMRVFRKRFYEFSRNNKKFAKITIALFFISYFFVKILKELWGRVRFRDLSSNFSNFTPWYVPNGITGAHSFPSGHAMMGWMLLPLILLAKEKWKKYLIGFLVVLWGFFVSFGRVLIGAHYASDVLFSSGIVIVTFLILLRNS